MLYFRQTKSEALRVKKNKPTGVKRKGGFYMLIHKWKETTTKGYNGGMMIELLRFIDGKEYYIGRNSQDETFYIDIEDKKEAQEIINLFEMEQIY